MSVTVRTQVEVGVADDLEVLSKSWTATRT
jgi:hypothetical protein